MPVVDGVRYKEVLWKRATELVERAYAQLTHELQTEAAPGVGTITMYIPQANFLKQVKKEYAKLAARESRHKQKL